MSRKETFNKAYGNIPKEVSLNLDLDISPFRSLKYYWICLKRKFTRT